MLILLITSKQPSDNNQMFHFRDAVFLSYPICERHHAYDSEFQAVYPTHDEQEILS